MGSLEEDLLQHQVSLHRTFDSTLVEPTDAPIVVRVERATRIANDINQYELSAITPAVLPQAAAGSHIDVVLNEAVRRSYSLIAADPSSYVIAVKREISGRGGSRLAFDSLKVGRRVCISPPRNNFSLNEEAEHSVFVAGGIGITPIFAMATRLQQLGKPWRLYYAVRTRSDAAFVNELAKLGSTTFHFDDECDGRLLDIPAIVASAPPASHLYCCGPSPMLAAFSAATNAIAKTRVHIERFGALDDANRDGDYFIRLGANGPRLLVSRGETILDVLRRAGMDVPASCEQGVCGTCETRVIEGTPDHRDSVLTAEERASNKAIMVCCSGSRSSELVLDLEQ